MQLGLIFMQMGAVSFSVAIVDLMTAAVRWPGVALVIAVGVAGVSVLRILALFVLVSRCAPPPPPLRRWRRCTASHLANAFHLSSQQQQGSVVPALQAPWPSGCQWQGWNRIRPRKARAPQLPGAPRRRAQVPAGQRRRGQGAAGHARRLVRAQRLLAAGARRDRRGWRQPAAVQPHAPPGRRAAGRRG